MNNPAAYAPPMIETARDEIAAILVAFQTATGLPVTYANTFACNGDPKFAAKLRENNFKIGTYDTINSRVSAVWPDDAAWPEGVRRLAPAEISAEDMAELTARLEKIAADPRNPATIKRRRADMSERVKSIWPDDASRPNIDALDADEIEQLEALIGKMETREEKADG